VVVEMMTDVAIAAVGLGEALGVIDDITVLEGRVDVGLDAKLDANTVVAAASEENPPVTPVI
jgi:hypothetical protein